METQQSPQAPAAKEDLSSKTILILVVLVVIVSVIGAWVNFSLFTGNLAVQQRSVSGPKGAEVGFNLIDTTPKTDGVTGHAAFEIVDK